MREFTFCLTVVLLLLSFGCSDVQRVCPTGPEAPYMAMAAEYWSGEGYPAEVASDDCTIRTRLEEQPVPGERWGNLDTTVCQHKLYDLLVNDSLPSHMTQSEIRCRPSMWDNLSHLEKVFVATHELGHAWYPSPKHPDWMPMVADVPSETIIKKWLKSTGHQSFIEP